MTKLKRARTDVDSEPLPEQSLDAANDLSNGRDPAVLDILPGITRKITACGACSSLQRNTELLQHDVRDIHALLDTVCQHLSLPRPQALRTGGESSENEPREDLDDLNGDQADLEGCEISPPDTPSAVQAPIDTFLDIAKLGSPGSSDNTPPSMTRQKSLIVPQDLISKGVTTSIVAETLVERYSTRLDPYLYGICREYRSWQQIRKASPVLFAAVCTVSALQDPQGQAIYEACNREFRRLVSRSLFEKHDLEYVRALSISSFWLSDASRILSSDAIRRSADMRLHRSLNHLSNIITDPQLMPPATTASSSTSELGAIKDRLRLWYLIFISDQHQSILHNRDPLLRSDKEISLSWETLVARDDTTDSDIRIISQVALLVIMSQVRDLLGSDQETRIPQSSSSQITHYSRQLDRWFNKFSVLFKPDPFIGDFPKCGLQLHYHFGKLYLGHQVFKGLNGEAIPLYFQNAANMAHEAAIAIFEMILHQENLRHNLVGMPHYFHIMIAFAGHFLLEVSKNYHAQLSIEPVQDFELIRRVLEVFQDIPTIQQHPICRMTPGLTRKLHECIGSLQRDGEQIIPSLATTSTDLIGYHIHGVQRQMHQPPSSLSFPGDSLVTPVDDFLLTDFGEFTFPGMSSN
ncbi:hypothetical protein N7462_006013 [Penicillium macrosclerotiorum]|uniref:uncharacterized protein n=1 Tax=Penicillium macrosclerotiorum TaxID=303699 RepID=UPI002549A2ED|nr:uncharacterized protein N7462_006013 [Penicillium macrosclerotiorum]KAJ5682848.1 hypothetical protein N7462_006013 [Penicillium macrosclerotiorum]